jgi:transcriptional regulator with XRE-family HTH domain
MRKVSDSLVGMESSRFSDQIREAVDASGMSRYAICKAIGLNQGAMSRFMSGKSGMSMAALDRLAELLGLRVVARRRKDH